MIRLNRFRGEAPRISPWLLPAGAAQSAINAKCHAGDLRAYRTNRRVARPSKVGTKLSLYRWGAVPGGEFEGAIAAVANTTPVRVTTAASHGLTTGQWVFIGATGLAIDNASYVITVINATQFDLDVSVASGAASTGEWTRQNGFWFHWITDVDVVRSPVAGDTTERTYFTGDGAAPKVTDSTIATSGAGTNYPNNSYTLGVPAPVAAPGAALVLNSGSVTGATQANPVQITTGANHGLTTGDQVYLAGLGGMTQLNGRTFTVTVTGNTTYTLDGENGTSHTAYTSGGTWEERYAKDNVSARAYVYTYVTGFGEEGPPSPASTVINVGVGQTVNLSGMSTGPGTGYNAQTKRIYRAVTGSNGTEFLFVAEIAVATTTYTDTKLDDALGEALPSRNWDPPPSDMKGIVALPNGVVVGFSKNDVCPSVPNQPHAYPVGWRQPTDKPIVAIGVFHQTAVVLTQGHPYLLVGSDPAAMTLLKIENHQSCASKRGARAFMAGVAYPSPDGLMWIGPGGEWRNLTEGLMTRDDWQALKPSSIHGYVLDGRYIGFYDNGATQGAFIYDPDNVRGGLFKFDTYATAGFVDMLSDALYLQVGDYIERWEGGGARKTYTWKSRPHYGAPRRYCVGKALATSYADLTVKLYADNGATLIHSEKVLDSSPFRFNLDERKTDWMVEITGTDTVYDVFFAETMEEIRQMLQAAQ